MKLKILVGILIFLIILNLATIGSYIYFQINKPESPHAEDFQPPGPGSGQFGPPPRLQLDQQQRQQLRALLWEFKEDTQSLEEEILQLQGKIFQLMQRESVPEKEIYEKLADIANLRLEISKKATQKLINAKEFLTPVQQEHFYRALIMHAGPGKPGPHRHRGRGMHRGPMN